MSIGYDVPLRLGERTALWFPEYPRTSALFLHSPHQPHPLRSSKGPHEHFKISKVYTPIRLKVIGLTFRRQLDACIPGKAGLEARKVLQASLLPDREYARPDGGKLAAKRHAKPARKAVHSQPGVALPAVQDCPRTRYFAHRQKIAIHDDRLTKLK